ATAVISASPPQVGWPRFSRDGTLEGSQPAMSGTPCPRADRPWQRSNVVGGTDASSIRSITDRHSLAPSSWTRRPVGVPYEHAVRPQWRMGWEDCGSYLVPLHDQAGGRLCFWAGGATSVAGER